MTDLSDRKAVWTAGVGVAVVALTAAVISFSHVRQLALEAGESRLASWLLPISIDGAIAAAVAVILADSRAGRRPTGLTWMLLALGLSGSLAANIASAEPTMVARAVAAWPPVALALGIEVLAGLARRREDADHTEVPAGAATPSGAPAASSNGTRANGSPAPGILPVGTPEGGNSAGQPLGALPAASQPASVEDDEAVAIIQQLDADAPGGRVSRLQIQKHLGCGGSRAARLAVLARGR